MLSEGGEENSIYHAFAAPFKRAGTTRATSSIIKSGQKDNQASILGKILSETCQLGSSTRPYARTFEVKNVDPLLDIKFQPVNS